MNDITLLINDSVYTEDFGNINFLTVKDLAILGEDGYQDFLTPFRLHLGCYGIDDIHTYKDFDLFFAKNKNKELFEIPTKKGNKKIQNMLLKSLSFIFKEEIFLLDCAIAVGNKLIHRDNFDELCNIILKSLHSEKIEIEETPIFQNERQRDIYEKLMAGRQKDAEKNQLHFDIIIKTVALSMGKLTHDPLIKNMTLWQLIDNYQSVMAKESCQVNFSYLAAGVDTNKSKLDLTHWSEKIKHKE